MKFPKPLTTHRCQCQRQCHPKAHEIRHLLRSRRAINPVISKNKTQTAGIERVTPTLVPLITGV
jgi:hypothetical protein